MRSLLLPGPTAGAGPRGERGAAILWILVGAAALVAGAIVLTLQLQAAPGPVTFTVYEGRVAAPSPFPAAVGAAVPVTYSVTTKTVTVPYGAGPGFPPLSTSTPVAVEDASVKAQLRDGDALFAGGGATATATTDAAGSTVFTVQGAVDGDDRLSFTISVTTGSLWWKKVHAIPDPAALVFETTAP